MQIFFKKKRKSSSLEKSLDRNLGVVYSHLSYHVIRITLCASVSSSIKGGYRANNFKVLLLLFLFKYLFAILTLFLEGKIPLFQFVS